MAVRARELGIAGEYGSVERFGERHIRCVVRCQGTAQLPDARQQVSMRVPLNDEGRKVIKCLLCTGCRDALELHQAA